MLVYTDGRGWMAERNAGNGKYARDWQREAGRRPARRQSPSPCNAPCSTDSTDSTNDVSRQALQIKCPQPPLRPVPALRRCLVCAGRCFLFIVDCLWHLILIAVFLATTSGHKAHCRRRAIKKKTDRQAYNMPFPGVSPARIYPVNSGSWAPDIARTPDVRLLGMRALAAI